MPWYIFSVTTMVMINIPLTHNHFANITVEMKLGDNLGTAIDTQIAKVINVANFFLFTKFLGCLLSPSSGNPTGRDPSSAMWKVEARITTPPQEKCFHVSQKNNGSIVNRGPSQGAGEFNAVRLERIFNHIWYWYWYWYGIWYFTVSKFHSLSIELRKFLELIEDESIVQTRGKERQ